MAKSPVFVTLISSANTNKESVIEFNVVPNEKSPWHYHTLFSETFEVLKGTLEVGRNKIIHHLIPGDTISMKPTEKHYFNNVSGEECLLRVTINPGNRNFEKAMLISKGLTKDGLANVSGIPNKISDLALILYLYNSKMVGIRKMVEPLFNYLAQSARRKGRLDRLTQTYCDR